jgi:hypothetical protein
LEESSELLDEVSGRHLKAQQVVLDGPWQKALWMRRMGLRKGLEMSLEVLKEQESGSPDCPGGGMNDAGFEVVQLCKICTVKA